MIRKSPTCFAAVAMRGSTPIALAGELRDALRVAGEDDPSRRAPCRTGQDVAVGLLDAHAADGGGHPAVQRQGPPWEAQLQHLELTRDIRGAASNAALVGNAEDGGGGESAFGAVPGRRFCAFPTRTSRRAERASSGRSEPRRCPARTPPGEPHQRVGHRKLRLIAEDQAVQDGRVRGTEFDNPERPESTKTSTSCVRV